MYKCGVQKTSFSKTSTDSNSFYSGGQVNKVTELQFDISSYKQVVNQTFDFEHYYQTITVTEPTVFYNCIFEVNGTDNYVEIKNSPFTNLFFIGCTFKTRVDVYNNNLLGLAIAEESFIYLGDGQTVGNIDNGKLTHLFPPSPNVFDKLSCAPVPCQVEENTKLQNRIFHCYGITIADDDYFYFSVSVGEFATETVFDFTNMVLLNPDQTMASYAIEVNLYFYYNYISNLLLPPLNRKGGIGIN